MRDGYLTLSYDDDPVHVHLASIRERLQADRAGERARTRAMVNAHAEHVRAQTEQAAVSATSERASVLAQEHVETSTEEDMPDDAEAAWNDDGNDYLDRLGAINGGLS